MWYLIVSIPDLCNLTYFSYETELYSKAKYFRSVLSNITLIFYHNWRLLFNLQFNTSYFICHYDTEHQKTCLSPPVTVLLTVPRRCIFCGFFLLLTVHVCLYFCLYFAVWSVPCSLVVTCWERADIMASLYVMFFFLRFCHFPQLCPGSGVVLDSVDS